VVADNSFGSGSVATNTIPGAAEPAGTGVSGRFLISVVAVQGTGATAATLTPPTTPGVWTPIGDWICNGGSGNEIHVAAAYRITDSNDAPGKASSWTFSGAFLASVVNTVYGGVDTSSPLDVVQQTPSCSVGSAGSIITAQPITTMTTNDVLIAAFAAAGSRNDISLAVGSPLGPVVGQDNGSLGPADFNAFGITTQLSPDFGEPGTYGPYNAKQAASGVSLAVIISAKP
jgi:hypothetical protein